MITERNNKIALFLTTTVVLFVVYSFYSSQERNSYVTELEKLSQHTTYSVGVKASEIFGINKEGVLGDFYHCLTKYRALSSRNPKPGHSRLLKLNMEGGLSIGLSVSNEEAFLFVLEKQNGNGWVEWSTSPLAVNCELALLNQK